MAPQALLVEDDTPSLEALQMLLQGRGYETTAVQTLKDARAEIEKQTPDLAILDLELPDGLGTELLSELEAGVDTEVVVITGHGTVDSAVEALHSGVFDYLTKPIDPKRLERVLSGVTRTLGLRKEVSELRRNLRRLGRFDLLVGSSPPMQAVYDLISRVAPTSTSVLLTGETGTGKDLTAETIHRVSRRSKGPFVAVNCGAIHPSLIESELFGHEPGSFTGAHRTRRGLFEQADGGSLFLDEITEMPPELQVRLLRVLESRSIKRVGGERTIEVDVRLLAATNRSPEKAVEEGKLREDLFYRLNVFPIRVPPLREREGDVELLASFFLNKINQEGEESKRFELSALDKLKAHDWPGNVRELRNIVELASILSSDRIKPEHVQVERTIDAKRPDSELSIAVGLSIAEVEKRLIIATLDRLGGNKKKAAETLGISLKTLYSRLNSYGLGRSNLRV